MRELTAQSPIPEERRNAEAERRPDDPFSLREMTGIGCAIVRTHRSHVAAAIGEVRNVCGIELPAFPGTSLAQGRLRVCWTEPGTWLLTGPADEIQAHVARLGSHEPRTFLMTTDLGSARMGFLLSGSAVRDVLASGCPLDLDASVFASGRCASTLFNEIAILLDRISDESLYRVFCERPLALALWDQLLDAATLLDRVP